MESLKTPCQVTISDKLLGIWKCKNIVINAKYKRVFDCFLKTKQNLKSVKSINKIAKYLIKIRNVKKLPFYAPVYYVKVKEFLIWRPLEDLNRRFHTENVTSWATRRKGQSNKFKRKILLSFYKFVKFKQNFISQKTFLIK